MSVVSQNQGPASQETSITQTNELALLQNIYLELKIMNILLKQGFSIDDSDGAIRNSLTLIDLQELS